MSEIGRRAGTPAETVGMQAEKITSDPFNWPSLQRKDLMSNYTLNEKRDLFRMTVPNMRPKTRDNSSNLRIDDIQGAQPKIFARNDINKPEFGLNNLDIEGSGPRLLHAQLNKVEYNLTNDDIDGSKPQWNKFITSRQPSNPLTPVYKLQSFQYVAPDPPKFLRDAMIHDDIEGTRPLMK